MHLLRLEKIFKLFSLIFIMHTFVSKIYLYKINNIPLIFLYQRQKCILINQKFKK